MSKLSPCLNCTKIELLYRQIAKLSDLSPSPLVNNLFSSLVSLAISDTEKHTLEIEKLNHLQQICSSSEFELEKFWANRIINSPHPSSELELFPYYQNYLDLTKLEYFSIQACSNHPTHHHLFIGGGPLPLTAIVLAKIYHLPVTILDSSEEACQISQKLISHLNLSNRVKIINQSGSDFNSYQQYDVISIAALAGSDPKTKFQILNQIKKTCQKSTHILARSSSGNRQLLYRPLGKEIYKIFTPLIEVHPQNHIVNSIVVMTT